MAGSACSFLAIVGDHCGHDSKDRSKSEDCLPILSCDRDISSNKSAFSIVGIENEVELLLARASIFSLPRNIEILYVLGMSCMSSAYGIGPGKTVKLSKILITKRQLRSYLVK